jgi:hypothetical protein
MLDLVQLLNPQQWTAIEAAARETILLLNDPDGEILAATLGEEFGRNQAAALDGLLQQSLPIFAYEVGKLIGPTIVELLLALVGIEIGPVAMVQKSLAAMKQIPRMAGVVRDLTLVFPNLPNGPTMPSKLIPDEASSSRTITELLSPEGLVSPRQVPRGLPDLSSEESALLARTGNRREFPDALPKDLADQELAIVKRAEKVSISDGDGKYINEVDLRTAIGGKSNLMGPGAGSQTTRPTAPRWYRRQAQCHQERSWRRLRIENHCWNVTRHGPRIAARIKLRWRYSRRFLERVSIRPGPMRLWSAQGTVWSIREIHRESGG